MANSRVQRRIRAPRFELRNTLWIAVTLLVLYNTFGNFSLDIPNPGLSQQYRKYWSSSLTVNNTSNNRVSLFQFVIHSSNNTNQSQRKVRKNWSNSKINLSPKTYSVLIIVLAGNVALNPGPYKPKYPCMECSKAAKYGQQAIECENCGAWFHRNCIGMNETIYKVLTDHPSYTWVCCTCGLPNFDSYFRHGTIELSNSFGTLSLSNVSTDPDIDNAPTCKPSPPRPNVTRMAPRPREEGATSRNSRPKPRIRPPAQRRESSTVNK